MKTFAVVLFLALAACVGQDSAKTAIVGCDAYATTLQTLSVWRRAGALSDRTIARVDQLRVVLNGVCSGEMPTNETVLIEFDAALTELIAIREGINADS